MILSCAGLAKTYAAQRGDIEAVKGIDFEVRAGEFTSIVGRSGSGEVLVPRDDRRAEPSVARVGAHRGNRHLESL